MSDLEKVLLITREWNDSGIPVKDALRAAYVALKVLEG